MNNVRAKKSGTFFHSREQGYEQVAIPNVEFQDMTTTQFGHHSLIMTVAVRIAYRQHEYPTSPRRCFAERS